MLTYAGDVVQLHAVVDDVGHKRDCRSGQKANEEGDAGLHKGAGGQAGDQARCQSAGGHAGMALGGDEPGVDQGNQGAGCRADDNVDAAAHDAGFARYGGLERI